MTPVAMRKRDATRVYPSGELRALTCIKPN
jgi:hypothetical protein